jgi:hypothetical protein
MLYKFWAYLSCACQMGKMTELAQWFARQTAVLLAMMPI